MKLRMGMAALCAGMMLAACGTAGQHAPTSTPLAGMAWRVDAIAGRTVAADPEVTLSFGHDGRFSGSAGCNRMIGTYEATGDMLRIRDPGLTMMACPPAVMEQEQKLVEMLNSVARYHIDADGRLVLTTPAGATVTARPER